MLKIGMLGFGFMGVTHYRIYQSLPNTRVVGIFDFEPEKVKKGEGAAGNIGEGGEKLDLSGVHVTGSAEELIRDTDIDVIDICLPTYVHAEFAVRSLQAGKHVFCEKPMALNPDECDDMLRARDKSSQKLMIGHCVRFWPEYAVSRQIIEEKKYGEVVSAFFRRLSPTPTWSYRNWLLQEDMSGGALLDLHIHDIDYILNVFGEVRAVDSFGREDVVAAGSGVDYVVTRYRTDSEALVVAEGGWHFDPAFPFNMSFHINCEKATLVYDPAGEQTLSVHTADGETQHPSHAGSTGWDEELKYFADCVESGRDVAACPPEESKKAVQVAMMERRALSEA